MKSFIFCLLLLTTTILAVERSEKPQQQQQSQQSRLKEIQQIPKNMRHMNFDYKGTIKTKKNEFPTTGNYKFLVKGNNIYVLDKQTIDVNGKKVRVSNLVKNEVGAGKQTAWSLLERSCLVQHYSEDKGTFPQASKWKEIGNNKFELSVSNRFAIKNVLDKEFGKTLGEWANEEHDVKMKIQVTLKNNKVDSGKIIFFVDGKELATKTFRVVKHLDTAPTETDFQAPSECTQRIKQTGGKRVLNLFEVLLGFKEESALSEGRMNEESSNQVETIGKVEELEKKEDEEVPEDEENEDEENEDEENENEDENEDENEEDKDEEDEDEDEEGEEEEGEKERMERVRESGDRN